MNRRIKIGKLTVTIRDWSISFYTTGESGQRTYFPNKTYINTLIELIDTNKIINWSNVETSFE